MPHFRVRLAALLALAVLAGCTGSASAPSPSPSNSASSASPTPTLSEGQKAANEVVVKYRALIDQVRSTDTPDINKLLTVARDDAYNKWRLTVQDDFVSGVHQTGVTSVAILTTDVGSNSRQWIVEACVDFSHVDIVDRNGKSVMPTPGAKKVYAYTVDQDASSLSWYVTKEEARATC